MYTRLLGRWLAPAKMRAVEGDTDQLAFGMEPGGPRLSAMGIAALQMAKNKIVEMETKIAARLLEASRDETAFESGASSVAETGRTMTLGNVVEADPASLPDGSWLPSHAVYRGTVASNSNGPHACEVEVDPEASTAGALSAAMNAVADALASRGMDASDMSATPLRVWTAIREARSAKEA